MDRERGVRTFTSADLHHLPSGRWAFIIDGIDGFNPRTLATGEIVEIDGQQYPLLGIEVYAIADPTGLPFGLVVDGTRAAANAALE